MPLGRQPHAQRTPACGDKGSGESNSWEHLLYFKYYSQCFPFLKMSDCHHSVVKRVRLLSAFCRGSHLKGRRVMWSPGHTAGERGSCDSKLSSGAVLPTPREDGGGQVI